MQFLTKGEHTKSYETFSHRCIILIRYADDETIETLWLKTEVDKFLNNLGLHYLVHCCFSVYVCLTLELLCTLEINLFKAPNESSFGVLQLKTTGTLSFWLHNSNYQLPIEVLREIMHLSTNGSGDVPKDFNPNEF